MLTRKVKSGDPENVEAQAARRYWPLIFGKNFRRDRDGGSVNGLLNYGYTILRSAAARSVMAAGLHPTIGIHHANRSNAMCLVDDIMEPFRPIADLTVKGLIGTGLAEVTPDAKAALARLTIFDMQGIAGVSPLSTCMERLALSIVRSYETGQADLDLPHVPLPLDLMQGTGLSDD
jgi:CRISPR-associated protein Cas1